jgi:hypothetical protein
MAQKKQVNLKLGKFTLTELAELTIKMEMNTNEIVMLAIHHLWQQQIGQPQTAITPASKPNGQPGETPEIKKRAA